MLSNAEGCCLNIRIRQRYVDRSIAANDSVAGKEWGGGNETTTEVPVKQPENDISPCTGPHFTQLPPPPDRILRQKVRKQKNPLENQTTNSQWNLKTSPRRGGRGNAGEQR